MSCYYFVKIVRPEVVMVHSLTRRFLVIKIKYFDVGIVGRRGEGLRVSESERGFRLSICFWREEVRVVVGLQEFYWMKAEDFWVQSMVKNNMSLWVAIEDNKCGRFIVFT